MKPFMNENFLLESEAARALYHDYAAQMPIIDYHCHISPREIAEDRKFTSVSELLLGGDHYKWRLMRCNGVPEAEITGALRSDPYKVFERFAETLPRAAGNPVYHWTHLELRRYFGIETPLNRENARYIYDVCNRELEKAEMSARGIMKRSNVKLICTTDDPVDSLEYHELIASDADFEPRVLPAFRPDRAANPDKPDFAEYLAKLAQVSGVEISDFASLCAALDKRIDFFAAKGCRTADHALERCVFASADGAQLDKILQTAISGGALTKLQKEQYRTAVLLHLARKYHALGWVMQIHFGCMRDNNGRMYRALGPDTGFDAIGPASDVHKLSYFFNALEETRELPRMVLYSLNPADNELIATMAVCFTADAECPGKIQLGAAWWFNDTKSGMEKQLRDCANGMLLGNFIGMLTDSRSFLSYTRHEYFRRILCNFLGNLMENGEYAPDFAAMGRMAQDICYNNTKNFFGFDC